MDGVSDFLTLLSLGWPGRRTSYLKTTSSSCDFVFSQDIHISLKQIVVMKDLSRFRFIKHQATFEESPTNTCHNLSLDMSASSSLPERLRLLR